MTGKTMRRLSGFSLLGLGLLMMSACSLTAPGAAPGPTPVVNPESSEAAEVTATASPVPGATLAFGLVAIPSPTAPPTLTPEALGEMAGRILFVSDRAGRADIYQVSPYGTGLLRLSGETGVAHFDPALSPDASQIAVSIFQFENFDIGLLPAEGGRITQRLAQDFRIDSSPDWSPDGTQIVFASDRDGDSDIYLVNIENGTVANLTRNSVPEGQPRWSPDGSHILFWSFRDGNHEIYVMNPDGTGQMRLTYDPLRDVDPRWSPDGTQILFTRGPESEEDGGPVESERTDLDTNDIYIMAADGSNIQQLTSTPHDDYQAAWSPNAAFVVFVSMRDGNPELYVMKMDGSAQTRITESPSLDISPQWIP